MLSLVRGQMLPLDNLVFAQVVCVGIGLLLKWLRGQLLCGC